MPTRVNLFEMVLAEAIELARILYFSHFNFLFWFLFCFCALLNALLFAFRKFSHSAVQDLCSAKTDRYQQFLVSLSATIGATQSKACGEAQDVQVSQKR